MTLPLILVVFVLELLHELHEQVHVDGEEKQGASDACCKNLCCYHLFPHLSLKVKTVPEAPPGTVPVLTDYTVNTKILDTHLRQRPPDES